MVISVALPIQIRRYSLPSHANLDENTALSAVD